jgi:hypothetical protein
METKIDFKQNNIIYIFLCLLFVLTVQQFDLFKGNILYLIHAIKELDENNLQNDWIANQTDHLPLFTFLNYLLIKIFSKKIIFIIHSILLGICCFSIFLICRSLFPKLKDINLSIIWFALFILVFHDHSFFSGVAGHDVINEGYQPASYGVLFFLGIYFFLINKNFLCILFICLAASFHPTYILHSGFIFLAIIFYYFFEKKYFDCFKLSFLYTILILPIFIFIFYNFVLIDENIVIVGQKILLNRIPHHANIHYWLSYKDILFILIYLFSLYLIKNNRKFLFFFSIFGFFPILLSFIQFFLNLNSLALAFPWRSSVVIAPISSMIILSFFLEKIKIKEKTLNLLSKTFFIIIFCFFSFKSHYLKNENLNFKDKLDLSQKIKDSDIIERILIPITLEDLRMNIGIPIFIDWKHAPLKFDEVIYWNERIQLASNFYNYDKFIEKKRGLKEIQKIEKISHILINKNKVNFNCENLIDDKIYSLFRVSDCFID